MLRSTRVSASPLCSIVRGVGRVLEAALLPSPLSSHAQAANTTTTTTTTTTRMTSHTPPPPPPPSPLQQPTLSPQLVAALSQTRYSEAKTLECRPVPATRLARAASFSTLLLHIAWDRVKHTARKGGSRNSSSSSNHQRLAHTSALRSDGATAAVASGASGDVDKHTDTDVASQHDAHTGNSNNDNNIDSNVDNNNDGGILSLDAHERIAKTLCRMRGVVLKLAQMLSMQDDSVVPPAVMRLFERARDSAYAMPRAQLHRALARAYDDDAAWRSRYFVAFDERPVAAASIGQVHHARLRRDVAAADDAAAGAAAAVATTADVTHNSSNSSSDDVDAGVEVAVKVQYPGVAQSIDADVANLRMLISLNVLPPGMFVDKVLAELRRELTVECQYTLEAQKQMRYRALVQREATLRECFHVPRVYTSVSRQHVLVSEFVRGVPIDTLARRGDVPQALRDYLAEKVMQLTLYELFKWQFMQTDPNYSNFLYDAPRRRVHLLDFGAARAYEGAFVRDYCDVVAAAARGDGATVVRKSIVLGFLTGYESREMIDAHVASVLLLGRPFRDRDAPFDFAAQNLPQQIRAHVPTMVRLRLTSPPTPIYSLHRRLSGTILLATRYGAKIHCGRTFWQLHDELQQQQQQQPQNVVSSTM